ncbi:MAG: hypothetical protein FJ225_10700 [Lentisphaerae bacterium]|nr:hypothetical protein [Lentisphaerota bacterium]
MAVIPSLQRDLFQTVKRAFLRALAVPGAMLFLAAVCVAYARFVEPHWLRVKRVSLSPAPTVRLIHVSDIHFAGDARHLERVTRVINRLDADMVCFTGDLIEEAVFLDGALQILSEFNKPLYGVPGNHDRWALRSFERVREAFRGTGGEWMTDNPVMVPSERVALLTLACAGERTPRGYKRILLEHHPDAARQTHGETFDLILAGHTHGGQVRIPFVHRQVLPFDLEEFDKGLSRTPAGPLYVNPGIGTFYLNMRFRCRPEITLIEL